ncbi:MAG: hypothetical protein RR087_01375 [Oscillospiraceae bacterium]
MIQWKEKLQGKIGVFATKLASHEMLFWPPICVGPYYQPERPERQQNNEETADF